MRIDLRTAYDANAIDQAQRTSAKPSAQKQAEAAGTADVSSDVRLSGLEAKVASAPDIRQDRVEQLRQAIASGTYSVSDEQLADAMLRDTLQR